VKTDHHQPSGRASALGLAGSREHGTMTERDADQLKEWLDGLTLAQFKLLWRWVTFAYMERCRLKR
jgi:hypothetical protein